ncbi:MAG TPA: polysaccharide biosynthesis/export family protein [Pirellulales bacterium]|nr:polysaccharide biosynthesis/export family protein [Pirellulales bacterium]
MTTRTAAHRGYAPADAADSPRFRCWRQPGFGWFCLAGGLTAALVTVAVSSSPQPAAMQEPHRLPPPVSAASIARKSNSETARRQRESRAGEIQLCQALGPAAPYPISGLDCATGTCGELGWKAARPIAWQAYAQGEYVGHERTAHVPEYRLRVDDELEFVYRLTREETSHPYQLNVGDEIRVESFTDEALNRDLIIQPDGTITLRLLGQVKATKRDVAQLRDEIEELYQQYYKTPAITVTPLRVNTRLEDLRATVDSRFGFGGQSRRARVTPEGTIQLPAVGSVPAQGLSLNELKRELDERYAAEVEGIEITPVLTTRAPRYVYVLGEVRLPGRYTLEGPTTVMQAISLAGGWNHGGNLWRTVVFRRGDDWRLMATMLDLRGPLYGHRPCPADEIWLNDSDIVLIPKTGILVANNVIDLIFTHGLYGIVPFGASTSFSITKFGTL